MPLSQLDLSIGAVEVGITLSIFLFGVCTVQTYTYHQNNFKDPLWTRLLVYLCWCLEAAHSVLLWHYLYDLTITQYAHPAAIESIPRTLSFSVFVGGVISAAVQSYFAYRIHVVSQTWLVSIIAWLGSATRVAITLAVAITSRRYATLVDYIAAFKWLITLSFGLSVALDVLNSASVAFFLLRKRTGFAETKKIVDWLVVWSIETGLITSLCNLAMLILIFARPHDMLWFCIVMFFTKFYFNSLLVSLNARIHLRQGSRNTSVGMQLPTSQGTGSNIYFDRSAASRNTPHRSRAGDIEVHISQKTEGGYDDDLQLREMAKYHGGVGV